MEDSTQGGAQRLGRRPTLTTLDAIAQSLAIGPIFSSAFVAFLIAGAAGGAAPLSTLIGAIGVLALGWLISLYARRGGGAGAIYDYLRRVNPALGLFAAGMYFLGALTLDAGGFMVIGLLGSQVLSSYVNLTVPWWALSLVALVLIFALNYLGVRLTTRVQLVLSGLSVIPVLILAVAIIAHGGDAGNTLQAFNLANVPAVPTSVPTAGVFPGILFAITLFIGFETAASLGEETRDPRRSIPVAIIGTVIITGIFYLLVVYALDIGYGLTNSAKWASDPAPLDTMATRYVGSWLAVLVDIAVLFDAIVGIVALLVTGIVAITQANVSTTVAPTNVLTAFGIMSTIGSLLIELIYIGLCLAALRFLLAEPGKWWRWLFLLVAIVTPVLGIYGSVVPFPLWPQSLGIYIVVAVIVLSLIWTLVNQFVFPERLGKASEPHPWEIGEASIAEDVAPAS